MRTVFLDRDGVINENRADHVKSWAEFAFVPGALQALRRLNQAGIQAFIVTNQAIVNRGVVTRDIVDKINGEMLREVERSGGKITAVAYCPHRPDEKCGCRKPQPGLLLALSREHQVDLTQSVIIGDALGDVDAGLSAGCRAILVLTGRGSEQLAQARRMGKNGFTVVQDLVAAVDLLLQSEAAVLVEAVGGVH